MDDATNVLVIHYSCETMYPRPDSSSPRIASISVMHLATQQADSFSIQLTAERSHGLQDIEVNYLKFEREMLQEFFDYVDRNPKMKWLHWNMRSINFGFEALEHRFKVLGGKPISIHDNLKFDLSAMLFDMYGSEYIGHPHLERLMEKNNISKMSFLNGAAEAKAFERGEYVAMQQSTLIKVGRIATIAERAASNELKTDAVWRNRYGLSVNDIYDMLGEVWWWKILALVSVPFTIIGTLITVIPFLIQISTPPVSTAPQPQNVTVTPATPVPNLTPTVVTAASPASSR